MKQRHFEMLHREFWDQMAAELNIQSESGAEKKQPTAMPADFPVRYRRLCQQLATARDRNYAPALVDYLATLAQAGHNRMYQKNSRIREAIADFLGWRFPQMIRREWRLVLLMSCLFYGPLFGVAAWVDANPENIYSIMEFRQVQKFENMYDPEAKRTVAHERGSDSDFQMFGFYIANNIGIGFRSFAGGIFLGVPTILTMLYNGTYIGAVTGHVLNIGYEETFFTFVIAHGAFELTGIVFAGVAGLMLARGLVFPGFRTRLAGLRYEAGQAVMMVYGIFAMLLIAAFVEAFWSSINTLPAAVKYSVGGLCWLAVGLYFLFAGKHRAT